MRAAGRRQRVGRRNQETMMDLLAYDTPHPRSRLLLAVPPSTNRLYVIAGSRRVKTVAYRRWLTSGYTYLNRNLALDIVVSADDRAARYAVGIRAFVSRRRDIDNMLKPILDRLVKERVILDDRYVDCLQVERVEPDDPLSRVHRDQCFVEVRLLAPTFGRDGRQK